MTEFKLWGYTEHKFKVLETHSFFTLIPTLKHMKMYDYLSK